MSNELQNIVAEMLDLSLEGSVVREWANRLQATLPAAGGAVEAVAWMHSLDPNLLQWHEKLAPLCIDRDPAKAGWTPLYTTPPSPPVAEAVDAEVKRLHHELRALLNGICGMTYFPQDWSEVDFVARAFAALRPSEAALNHPAAMPEGKEQAP